MEYRFSLDKGINASPFSSHKFLRQQQYERSTAYRRSLYWWAVTSLVSLLLINAREEAYELSVHSIYVPRLDSNCRYAP